MFAIPTKATSKVATIPAPIGGLNALDSLAAMPPTDAPAMVNWYPQPYGVILRKGYQEHTIGLAGAVETVLAWSSGNGAQKLFAWADEHMYDATTFGPVGAPILSGLTNSIWHGINFGNTAGVHLVAFNGHDDGIIYDDTGLHRLVAGNGTDPYSISGVDPKNIIACTSHEQRLWMVEKNTGFGWYLPTDALYGIAKRYDFGAIFKRGGYLSVLKNWTVDDGNGAEDHLVAISSHGEVAVYSGYDVEDPTNWLLVGVYYAGAPLGGRRFSDKVGGDLMLITQVGVVSLSNLLQSSQVNETSMTANSSKIQFLLQELTDLYRSSPGWEIFYNSTFNMLLVNVPSTDVAGTLQVVCNLVTGAWTLFSGIPAVDWVMFNDYPYFGSKDGKVYRGWVGTTDGVELDGAKGRAITAQVQQAYTYFDAPAVQKQVGMYRPNLIVDLPVNFYSDIQYDFAFVRLPDPTPTRDFGSPLWDQAIWDQSTWYGGSRPQRDWFSANGIGAAVSIRMAVASKVEVLWVGTDYSFRVGGVL
jgi:hypothetical protein